MAVDSLRSAVSRLPPLPELVHPTATSSDPGQMVEIDDKGRLRIRGLAVGSAGAGPEVTLAFDGLTVSVGLRAGITPQQTLGLLERVMPPGYRIALAAEHGDECVLEIIRRPRNRPAPALREEPKLRTALQAVTDAFAS